MIVKIVVVSARFNLGTDKHEWADAGQDDNNISIRTYLLARQHYKARTGNCRGNCFPDQTTRMELCLGATMIIINWLVSTAQAKFMI